MYVDMQYILVIILFPHTHHSFAGRTPSNALAKGSSQNTTNVLALPSRFLRVSTEGALRQRSCPCIHSLSVLVLLQLSVLCLLLLYRTCSYSCHAHTQNTYVRSQAHERRTTDTDVQSKGPRRVQWVRATITLQTCYFLSGVFWCLLFTVDADVHLQTPLPPPSVYLN